VPVFPDSDEMKTRCPSWATIPSASAGEDHGARRLTWIARSICSSVYSSSGPDPGTAAFGDQQVDVAHLGDQAVDLGGLLDGRLRAIAAPSS